MKTKSSTSSKRWWDFPAAFLLMVVLTTAFARLIATQWTEHLNITSTVAYMGLISGLALGKSRFSPRLSGFFATLYGLFVISWRIGLTLGAGIPWMERMSSITGRLGVIVTDLVQQRAVSDNLLFLLLMGILFWFLSSYSGYSIIRYGDPWRAILPSGLALVVIHSYDSYLPNRIWYLLIFLFFALLLVARLVYLQNRNRWSKTNTYMPPYLGMDFIRITLVITTVLILFSWTMPALADSVPVAERAWARVKQPWDDIRNTFDNAFASLKSTVGVVNDYFGTSMALGRGDVLTDAQVLLVNTPANPPDGTRFYWRARIYDIYEGGSWQSSVDTSTAVNSEDYGLQPPQYQFYAPEAYSFSFTTASTIANLFTVGQPVWLSRPAKAIAAFNEDETADIVSFRATPPIHAGESYTERALLPEITISDLRDSSQEYPAWITDRYLQLPDTITERTITLAEAITADEETTYDKAMAITSYLRGNIEYQETVPSYPPNQDPVDWFLFDYGKGYCVYYASAEVVMLRAIGIPARMARGYAQGELLDTPDTYLVRQRDAHAWPEVFFPEFGWVEFEPTVSQPALIRPLGEITASDSQSNGITNLPGLEDRPALGPELPEEGQPIGTGTGVISNLSRAALITILVVALLALSLPIIWRRGGFKKLPTITIALERGMNRAGIQPPRFLIRWSRYAALSPLGRAYTQINSALGRLGRKPQYNDTPRERADVLVSVLPEARNPAYLLISKYQTAVYGSDSVDENEAVKAGSDIRWLSIKALLRKWFTQPEEKNKRDPFSEIRNNW